MNIYTGEIYGKQTGNKFVMYSVLKVSKSQVALKNNNSSQNQNLSQNQHPSHNIVTLQNIDNPLSFFETTQQKLINSGYIRISQTPFINTALPKSKKKIVKKPLRCPYTLDFLEARADNERPAPIFQDLFSELSISQ